MVARLATAPHPVARLLREELLANLPLLDRRGEPQRAPVQAVPELELVPGPELLRALPLRW